MNAATLPAAGSAAPSAPVLDPETQARMKAQAEAMARAQRLRLMTRFAAPVVGFAFFLLVWQAVAHSGDKQLPGPMMVLEAAIKLFSDPFYVNGPNDQGIGWNVLASLQRVAVGFGLAALVGIPLGFLIGRFAFFNQMLDPIISLLRPVSPLAWLPIGLMVFKAANPAAIWTIFICSIWPMVINTAVGVASIPEDLVNVSRVLRLSPLSHVRRIVLPAAVPMIFTGMRLSLGIAWMVLIAAEMLAQNPGLGKFVWDEFQNGSSQSLARIMFAVIVIGFIGFLLDRVMMSLQALASKNHTV